ncbi:hypothetical protein Plhal304r1_c040g0118551 [Plasmopara halstedii]
MVKSINSCRIACNVVSSFTPSFLLSNFDLQCCQIAQIYANFYHLTHDTLAAEVIKPPFSSM